MATNVQDIAEEDVIITLCGLQQFEKTVEAVEAVEAGKQVEHGRLRQKD